MAPDIVNLELHRIDSATDTSERSRTRRKSSRTSAQHALDLRILGVCGGSGLNELNYALVHYRQDAPNAPLRVEMLQHCKIPIPSMVRNPILDLLREVPRKPSVILRLNALLGHMFSKGIQSFCQRYSHLPTSIHLVGTYAPDLRRLGLPETDNTNSHLLGWNTVVTAETGITAVSDFSVTEFGLTRPSIPPIAFVDRLLLRHPTKFRVCLDIEELANISFIPGLVDYASHPTISRDCGPGSLLIDYAMRYCTSNDQSEDYNGKFGSEGQVNQVVVDRFLRTHDYFYTAPPLSMAREMFGDHEAQRLIDECIYLNMSNADIIATTTRITAQNMLKQYLRLLQLCFPLGQKVDELFICGPSARNMNLIDYLEKELPESVVTKPLDDLGIPGDANEAVCCAHLALEAVLGQATTSVTTPSSPGDALQGKIVHGTNWEELLKHISLFSEGELLHVTKDVRVAWNHETTIKGRGIRNPP
ncbi:uncharacterized protein K460DRAFT_378909 [Cucurbitaria berberidis CBS 394.84]|uniref:Uncharacterized protein n=1 Tax=Cucurbitaria berberidis CBS 394.84 TaxID=1168544 RepID=A0A9P4L6E2_9PLEO|nr:uncharacterized protein K460DRAFT_378909 [Cucurbitaria berberidis CBS 394.84]KAF1843861.1 hypothetical protein K460DRAFT_378909 [Cucurbitaria berberidis CBS 394.84]